MWVVLGSNSAMKVQAFGPFDTEAEAEKWAGKMERKIPGVQWLPLPITSKNVMVMA